MSWYVKDTNVNNGMKIEPQARDQQNIVSWRNLAYENGATNTTVQERSGHNGKLLSN